MSETHILDGRSVAEAHLYMDIRGCEAGKRGHRLEQLDGDLVSVYECRCGGNQDRQRFVFRVLDDPLSVEGLGGEEPSRIIGPGEFLMYAEELARKLPATPAGLDRDQLKGGHHLIDRAAACVREVLKFLGTGEEMAPSAFRSTRGMALYRESPGRFGRARLTAVAGAYERIAQQYAEALKRAGE